MKHLPVLAVALAIGRSILLALAFFMCHAGHGSNEQNYPLMWQLTLKYGSNRPGMGRLLARRWLLCLGVKMSVFRQQEIEQSNSGHHHLMIDMDELPAMNMPLPGSAQLIHFGKGQSSTSLSLEPGVHSLQLVLGNHLHVPHTRPVLSEKITIVVK